MSFLEQFDPIEKNLKVKLNINMSNKKNVFSYNQYNKTLNVFINNNYRNVKETLNHEFLHVLDYYNGKNNEPFSEIYNNIEDKINKKPKIAKLQNYILKGENVKKNPSVLEFDFIMLKNSLEILLNKKDIPNIMSEDIEMLTISNLKSFNNFLNAVNILKGQYYLFIDDNGYQYEFNTVQYLNNKNRIFKDFKNLYDDIDHFEKRFNYINKKYGSFYTMTDFLKILNKVTKKNFNIFINNGLSTIENIFVTDALINIDEVRNIYYTPTLKNLTVKPNSLFLQRIVKSKEMGVEYYLFNASEKISYCGQKNEGNLLNTFVKLSLNKEHKIKFSKQPISEDYEQLSEDAKKAFVRFIKNKNEYIDYDPVLNIKNKKQKSITPKTNAPVVFCNPNKNPNTLHRDSVIQNIIKKQQLQKSTVQDQNIEVEKNKKPKI